MNADDLQFTDEGKGDTVCQEECMQKSIKTEGTLTNDRLILVAGSLNHWLAFAGRIRCETFCSVLSLASVASFFWV